MRAFGPARGPRRASTGHVTWAPRGPPVTRLGAGSAQWTGPGPASQGHDASRSPGRGSRGVVVPVAPRPATLMECSSVPPGHATDSEKSRQAAPARQSRACGPSGGSLSRRDTLACHQRLSPSRPGRGGPDLVGRCRRAGRQQSPHWHVSVRIQVDGAGRPVEAYPSCRT